MSKISVEPLSNPVINLVDDIEVDIDSITSCIDKYVIFVHNDAAGFGFCTGVSITAVRSQSAISIDIPHLKATLYKPLHQFTFIKKVELESLLSPQFDLAAAALLERIK